MSRPTLPKDTADIKEWFDAIRDFQGRRVCDSFTWDPDSVGATTVTSVTLTAADYPELSGLRVGMVVKLTPPADLDSGLQVDATWVATDDTLTVRFRNDTGSPIDQGSGTWSFEGVRP